MSDSMKQAWSDVAEEFSALGRALTQRARTADPEPVDAPSEHAEDRAAMRDALEQLITAARQFSNRAVEVARDEEVRSQAKRAGKGLTDALSRTAETISEQVGDLFHRGSAHASSSATSAGEPTGEVGAILDAGGKPVDGPADGEPRIEGPNTL
jgi:hypothetical protein